MSSNKSGKVSSYNYTITSSVFFNFLIEIFTWSKNINVILVWFYSSLYFVYRWLRQNGLELTIIIFMCFSRYHYTGYRQFVRWIYHFLGKEERVPLPSCVVSSIRTKFMSQEYCGFKYTALDWMTLSLPVYLFYLFLAECHLHYSQIVPWKALSFCVSF